MRARGLALRTGILVLVESSRNQLPTATCGQEDEGNGLRGVDSRGNKGDSALLMDGSLSLVMPAVTLTKHTVVPSAVCLGLGYVEHLVLQKLAMKCDNYY